MKGGMMMKRIVTVCLVLFLVFESLFIINAVYVAAEGHVHTDDCYEGHRHGDDCIYGNYVTKITANSSYGNPPFSLHNDLRIYCEKCGWLVAVIYWDEYSTPYFSYDPWGANSKSPVTLSEAQLVYNFIYGFGGVTQDQVINILKDHNANICPNPSCSPSWSCGLEEDTTPICNQVVTSIESPEKPYLVEYGTIANTIATVHYLDGHTEEKEVLHTIDTNTVGEQDIILSLTDVYVGTAKNPHQTISIPAKAIVYKICPKCGSRYITEECLICKCEDMIQKLSILTNVERQDKANAEMKADIETKKQQIIELQNEYLY